MKVISGIANKHIAGAVPSVVTTKKLTLVSPMHIVVGYLMFCISTVSKIYPEFRTNSTTISMKKVQLYINGTVMKFP